jgi:DnaJ domain
MSRQPPFRPRRPSRRKPKRDIFDSLLDFVGRLIDDFHVARPLPIPHYYQCLECGSVVEVPFLVAPQGIHLFCPAGHLRPLKPITLEQARKAQQRKPPPQIPGNLRIEAAIFLASHTAIPRDVLMNNQEVRRKAYRKAAARLHPDNLVTGNTEEFVKLQKAMEVLEKP